MFLSGLPWLSPTGSNSCAFIFVWFSDFKPSWFIQRIIIYQKHTVQSPMSLYFLILFLLLVPRGMLICHNVKLHFKHVTEKVSLQDIFLTCLLQTFHPLLYATSSLWSFSSAVVRQSHFLG